MKQDTSKFTEEEVRFILETANAGPESTDVKDAPTDRVAVWLINNWGLGQVVDEFDSKEGNLVRQKAFNEEPWYRTGHERVRHALQWLDNYTESIGWTPVEVEALMDKINIGE